MFVYKCIATFFGVGYVGKGSGTLASALFCVCLYLIVNHFSFSPNALILFVVITFIIGVIAAFKVEKDWGKDSKRVVIDEVSGMALSLVCLPITPLTIILGFILFRAFDILKPLYIRRLEKFPGGWGVMADDVLAGLYTNLLLQFTVYLIAVP